MITSQVLRIIFLMTEVRKIVQWNHIENVANQLHQNTFKSKKCFDHHGTILVFRHIASHY